jgi:hypothetical protein
MDVTERALRRVKGRMSHCVSGFLGVSVRFLPSGLGVTSREGRVETGMLPRRKEGSGEVEVERAN